MTTDEYLATLPESEQVLLKSYRNIIVAQDKTVTEEIGRMMSIPTAFIYKQNKAFKYALARTKNHFTFHCMVMYGAPQLIAAIKPRLPKVVFQKGCMNLKSTEDFPLALFEECMNTWAAVDYLSMIKKHFTKKK